MKTPTLDTELGHSYILRVQLRQRRTDEEQVLSHQPLLSLSQCCCRRAPSQRQSRQSRLCRPRVNSQASPYGPGPQSCCPWLRVHAAQSTWPRTVGWLSDSPCWRQQAALPPPREGLPRRRELHPRARPPPPSRSDRSGPPRLHHQRRRPSSGPWTPRTRRWS